MADDYSEDQFVEESAVAELAALGWETVSAWSEIFGERSTRGSKAGTTRCGWSSSGWPSSTSSRDAGIYAQAG